MGRCRRNYLVPEVRSLEELNRILAEQCLEEARRQHRAQAGTVGERFAAEWQQLFPRVKIPFLACTGHRVRVSHQQLATVGRRRYSSWATRVASARDTAAL